jgi:hypothetical protein
MTGLSRASGGLLRLPGQARDRRWRFRHRQPFPDPRLEAALGGFELALAQATVEGRWRPLLREESIPHGELTLPPWTIDASANRPRVDACHWQSCSGLGGDVRPLRLVLGLAAG